MLFLVAHACPNCGGTISDERLKQGLPCSKCLPVPVENDICKVLGEKGQLKRLSLFCEALSELEKFRRHFREAIGFGPSSLQETWIKRLLLRESFAIIAPTGTGKTTFGLLASLYFPGRVLILVPTRLLAQQIGERLEDFSKKTGISRKILVYLGKKKDKEAFAAKDFDILVCTTAFFYKHVEDLLDIDFEFVFIDDVDSFLKRSAHIESLFKLLGFSEREIALALKLRKSEKDFEKLEAIRKRHAGKKILLMSSATLKPRTSRVLLFRYLLGFEVQRAVSSLRNIVDAYEDLSTYDFSSLLEKVAELIKILGQGGLLFLSQSYGKEQVEKAVEFLRTRGFKVLSYLELSPGELMTQMETGEFDVAVGLAHLANPLVRGIDLPYVLRYALFLGVPKHVIPTKVDLLPKSLFSVLANIVSILDEEERLKAISDLQYLRRYLTLTQENLPRYPRILERLKEIKAFIENKFKDQAFLERLSKSEEVFLKKEGDELFLVIGDTATYIQASGRVSRLTAHGLLKGLSVVLVEDRRAFLSLERRLRFQLGDDFSFVPLETLDLEKLGLELTQVRRREQNTEVATRDFIKTALVVVESPHKAKTIASFFGKPVVRRVGEAFVYEIPAEDRVLMITASLGHVFNLSRRRGFFGVFKENSHFIPLFDSIKICEATKEQLVDPEEVKTRCPEGRVYDKREILESFRRLAFEIEEVYIGSDPDAEGEKIAYDLLIEMRPFNSCIRRLEFHEVTPRAFREAIKNPEEFNLNRVKAQLTRRVVDRWVGFVLSRKLWEAFGQKRLSAGRVQTPVLGWVIERADKAKQKKALISFKLFKETFQLSLEDLTLARQVFEALDELSWKILAQKEEEKNPLPPYTTDTVLQDASQRLKLPTRDTMNLLQDLFENGLITYHRTDSTRISEVGRFQVARPYIAEKLGEEYFYPRAWGEGGAHEGIRPTRPRDVHEIRLMLANGLLSLTEPERALRLYDLIFKRFMASQMRPALVEKTVLRFSLPVYSWQEEIITKVLRDGFERLYPTFKVIEFSSQAKLEDKKFKLVPRVELFTEGTLVQEMKKRGLGRPSTYAEIVTTLIQRKYVKVLPGGRLTPTRLGRKVYEFLRKNYPEYTDEALTRELEEAMDLIEEGKLDYQEVLSDAYYQIKQLI
ncbi:reverse gyrase [Thermodesulfatator autotrophicus]|uniref:Reverse gyrase n=1 Tax=Thermodesulfatator autotrophicus TaxID=1795632 RepID=A0A177E797_9BACT|nr:reverse gyrase [Thermodesulfatator autotrophicus]OAG27586.1 reverse gyrase [Thermodesulfatator autotrophicus]